MSETLKRRFVDICCLQEVRWKGQGAKMIGNCFKFRWNGVCKAENSVNVMYCYCYWGCSLGSSILLLPTGW